MVKNNRGFSLIELMVVVAIIGILATIAIPSYQDFQAKARQKEGLALLSSYYTAAHSTFAEIGGFPGNFVATGFQPQGQLKYRLVAADNSSAASAMNPGGGNVKYSDAIIEEVVKLSSQYLHDTKLPDKAIDIMDEAGAHVQLINNTTKDNPRSVTSQDLEHVVAMMAQVPTQTVSVNDLDKIKNLELRLKSLIYGQDEAIRALVETIKLNKVGLWREHKPMGSFLFAGPTGVGKTEVCKQLASHLGINLIRFDMSEYMEKHSISRLIGVPPGYVGYEAGGLLTEKVTQSPHCVLLLDEIEKAHPDLLNILLQVMDHGKLTDPHGKETNFKHVILVMTSNVGAREAEKGDIGISPSDYKGISAEAVKKAFAPEFINRLDRIVHFKKLSEDMSLRVAEKFLIELAEQLKQKKVSLRYNDSVKLWIKEQGFSPAYGARPMIRAVDEHIKRPIADPLLFGELKDGGTIEIDVQNKELKFKFVPLLQTQRLLPPKVKA